MQKSIAKNQSQKINLKNQMRKKQIHKNQEHMKTEIQKERKAFLSVFFILLCVFKVDEIQSEKSEEM